MIFDLNVVILRGREGERKKEKRPFAERKGKDTEKKAQKKTFLLRRENSLVEQILIIEVSF